MFQVVLAAMTAGASEANGMHDGMMQNNVIQRNSCGKLCGELLAAQHIQKDLLKSMLSISVQANPRFQFLANCASAVYKHTTKILGIIQGWGGRHE